MVVVKPRLSVTPAGRGGGAHPFAEPQQLGGQHRAGRRHDCALTHLIMRAVCAAVPPAVAPPDYPTPS